MSIESIKDKLKENSKQDNTWIERAKYRKEIQSKNSTKQLKTK